MSDETLALLPCPFCGAQPEKAVYRSSSFGQQWQVECGNADCPVESGTCAYGTLEQAAKNWNTRPSARCEISFIERGTIEHLVKREIPMLALAIAETIANFEGAGDNDELTIPPDLLPGVEATLESARFQLENVMLATKRESVDRWQLIDSAPRDRDLWLASYIVPSAEAARNGSTPSWHVAAGRHLGFTWTGILGGAPSYWQEIVESSPAPPGSPPDDAK